MKIKAPWLWVFLYVALVYGGLYFTPFISDYLKAREGLGFFINWVYAGAGFVLFFFFYFKMRVRNPSAYGMLGVFVILFFAAFGRMGVTTDRLHFLEHALIYILVYSALRYSESGIVLVGRTMFLCILISLVDEGIQGLLPNREADWEDIWTNIFSYYLGAGLVGVAFRYGSLSDKTSAAGRRDNLFLVVSVVAVVLWIQYASKVPSTYSWAYLLLLAILFIPFLYLLYLKKQIYQWSSESIFYLLSLTFLGIVSFSFSILGIDPGLVVSTLYQSALTFFG